MLASRVRMQVCQSRTQPRLAFGDLRRGMAARLRRREAHDREATTRSRSVRDIPRAARDLDLQEGGTSIMENARPGKRLAYSGASIFDTLPLPSLRYLRYPEPH